MRKQETTIKELKQAAVVASKATGLDIYVEGNKTHRYLCAKRPNGLKGYIGCIGTVDEVYAQLLAVISVAELQG